MTIGRFLTTAAAAVALSACGGDGESAPTVVTIPQGTPAPTPTPTPAPVPATLTKPSTPGSLRYPPATAVKPRVGIALPIGKCLNLAGQLDVPEDKPWMRPIIDADFPFIRKSGFRTIRLPVNFVRFTGSEPSYVIDPAFLIRVRRVVDVATAAGLNVIIVNHYEKALYSDPPVGKARLRAVWQQLSTAFSDAPANVYFELLNEPKPPYYSKELLELLTPVIADVRKNNPTRPIIIGGTWSSEVNALAFLNLPDDPYLVPTVHYYAPLAFTHQGAPFMNPVLPKGVTFGSEADHAVLKADLAKVTAYIERTGSVPFVGEYGAYDGIALDERAAYHDMISHAFASIGIQSCVWGYANSFPIRTDSGWISAIVDVLGTTKD